MMCRYRGTPVIQSVPFWNTDHFNMNQWLRAVKRIFTETNHSKGISVYMYDKTLGEILDDSELSRVSKATMGEIEQIVCTLECVETSFLKGK